MLLIADAKPDEVGNSHRQAQRQTWVSSGTHAPAAGWYAPSKAGMSTDGLPEKASIHNVLVAQLVVQRQCRAFCALLPAELLHRSEVLTSLRLPSHVGACTGWRPWMDCTVVLLYFLRASTGAMRERGAIKAVIIDQYVTQGTG